MLSAALGLASFWLCGMRRGQLLGSTRKAANRQETDTGYASFVAITSRPRCRTLALLFSLSNDSRGATSSPQAPIPKPKTKNKKKHERLLSHEIYFVSAPRETCVSLGRLTKRGRALYSRARRCCLHSNLSRPWRRRENGRRQG